MGGGGESKVKASPPKYGPYSKDILEELYGYSQGMLDQPLDQSQTDVLNRMRTMAQQGGQLTPYATGAIGNVIGTGGMDPGVRGFAGSLMGGGFVNPAFDETRRIAMGGDVGSNPYLEATYARASRPLIQQLQQDVNPAIDIGAASSGRLGSGMHALLRNRAAENTSQALTDLSTGIYGGAYEADQARRMGALGQLAGLGQQDVGNRMAGAGLYDTGAARTLQAAGMAPGLDEARWADPLRQWQFEEMARYAPYDIAGRYANVLGAFPKGGGTTTQVGAEGSPIAGGASGALGGAATGMMLGGPYGAAIGGGLGLLGGLFG